MTAPVFVVDAVPGAGNFLLDGPEGRHAVSVKRLREGEELVLVDGRGRWAACEVLAAEGKDRLTVRVAGVHEDPAEEPRITVVQALPKGDRGELAVETMTETGVDAIVPWAASRCITQWKGDRGLKALAKWRSTAREAGKQSRRTRFPEVADLMTTKQVAALSRRPTSRPSCTRTATTPAARCHRRPPREGVGRPGRRTRGRGLPEELAAFGAAGAKPYRLGRSVLRTSTAGTAATALVLGRTGRWS